MSLHDVKNALQLIRALEPTSRHVALWGFGAQGTVDKVTGNLFRETKNGAKAPEIEGD